MIDMHKAEAGESLEVPFAPCDIPAGFPIPVDDGESLSIDLNRELIRHPETTYCGRVRGESMVGANIHDGDILVIDRSLDWSFGDTVVAYVNGEFTLKRLERVNGVPHLMPANPDFPPIRLDPEDDVRIWGVVQWVIHRVRRGIG